MFAKGVATCVKEDNIPPKAIFIWIINSFTGTTGIMMLKAVFFIRGIDFIMSLKESVIYGFENFKTVI